MLLQPPQDSIVTTTTVSIRSTDNADNNDNAGNADSSSASTEPPMPPCDVTYELSSQEEQDLCALATYR